MTTKKKTEEIADPLAERKKVMGQHLKGQSLDQLTGKTENQKTDKPARQSGRQEPMVKVTFKLPASLHTRWQLAELAIKQANLRQAKSQRRVKIQDLFTEAVEDYVKKVERKYKVG